MPDEAVTSTEAAPEDVQAATAPTEGATPEVDAPPADDDYAAKWEGQRKVNRDLERKLKEARDEAQALREQAMPPEERERLRVEREANEKALDLFRQKVVTANLRAAAVGRLQDPSDANVFIRATDVPVDDDGNVDEGRLGELIDDLLSKKPHLAARGEPKVAGRADAGARKTPRDPSLDERIAAAQANGDWRTVISLQNTRLADAS